MADSGGVTTSLTYDYVGRVKTVDQTLLSSSSTHFVLSYSYDASGRVTGVTGSLAGVTTINLAYGWDDAGRLVSITDNAGDKRVEFGYNALGQYVTVKRYTSAGGSTLVAASSYGYDDASRLTSLSHALGSQGSQTLAYAFGYDVAGRMTQFVTPDGVSDLSLDNTGQLTGASLTSEPIQRGHCTY